MAKVGKSYNMDCLFLALSYYAHWLSIHPTLPTQGITSCFYTSERDKQQTGYSQPFGLYAYRSKDAQVITYGKQLEKDISWIEAHLTLNEFNSLREKVKTKLGKNLNQSVKYFFKSLPDRFDTSTVKQLTFRDYPYYLEFFETQYPHSQPETWLEEYFRAIAEMGYAFGYFADGRLVSASDAPMIPFMSDSIVEIGINTLEGYRKMGFSRTVIAAMLKYLIEQEKAPIWSTAVENIASQRLAESVGFERLAEVITIPGEN